MADVTTTFAAKDESFATTVDKLNGRLQGFQKDTDTFSDRVKNMASQFAGLVGPIAAVGAAFLGAKAAADAFGNALAMGGRLDDLSKRTGASAGEMLLLEKAFDLAGSSAEAVGPTISKLNRFLAEASEAGSAQSATLQRLGLTYTQLAELSPSEQMRLLAERISAIESPALKTQAAMDVFGKSGGELIPLLSDFSGELSKAGGFLGSLPGIMSENAAAFANLDDNVNEIRGKFDQFAAGLMTKMVPALTSVTDKIANIDAAGFGMMLSDYIAKMIGAAAEAFKLTSAIDSIKMAIESIVSGNFSEGLSLMWVTMKVTALNAINEIVSNFMAGFMTVRDFIAEMFNSQGALAHLMNTMFSTAAAYMKEQLSSSLADFMEAIGRIAMAEKFRYEAETAREHIERNLFAMGAQFELVGEQAAAAGRAMPENFEKNKDSLQPLFDLTPALAEQERLHESIKGKLEEMKTSTEGIATNAQSFSESLLSSETSLQNSELLTRSITLNLENSALASKRIASAFSLAEESSQSIAFNLETTSASTEEASGWLNKGATETERISLHGNEFASAADNAAGAIANAKVDAKITSDLFTGLSDRMNSAVNATSAMLDQMRETFHFGKMTEEEKVAMSRLETKQRLAENARDRAHERAARLEKLGFEKTAHELRMRADAKLTETLEKLRPELEKATESARQAMERGGQTAETGMRTGSNVAKTALLEGGNVAKDAIMKAADALKNSLPDPSKQSALALESTLDLCRGLLSSIDAKLPQHALS